LFIFARFHATAGREEDVASALRDVLPPTRAEAGCLDIRGHRAVGDKRLFYIHSRWVDEAAFEVHAGLPHTVRFVDQVRQLIDHELEVARTRPIIMEIRVARPEDATAAYQVRRSHRPISDLRSSARRPAVIAGSAAICDLTASDYTAPLAAPPAVDRPVMP
jgi:quinol monooxygenase YgiN